MIEKVANFTINNEAGKDLIKKVANFTINNEVGNDMINKFANMIINDIGSNPNGENGSDAQVQFTGDPVIISHQHLLSSRKIRFRH